MDSTLTVTLRITHTQNLPGDQYLADEVAKLLTQVLADDPQLLVTAQLRGSSIQSFNHLAPAEAHPVVMPRRLLSMSPHLYGLLVGILGPAARFRNTQQATALRELRAAMFPGTGGEAWGEALGMDEGPAFYQSEQD